VARRRGPLLVLAAALVAVALVPPLDGLAGRLLVAHMAQHVLLGDAAPLLVAATLTRRAGPAVALAVWAVSRAAWHVPVVFDAAAGRPWLHGLEHLSLFAGGLALWSAALGVGSLARRIGLVVAFQLGGMVLGLVLLWAGSPLYPRYAHSSLGGLTDQRAAAAVMMVSGTALTAALLTWLLLGALREERSGYAAGTGVPRTSRG
jgi:putative membrane protein